MTPDLEHRIRAFLEHVAEENCYNVWSVPCLEAIEECVEEDFCEPCRAAAILADWKEEG
jgi:hypothetical protein